MFMMFLNVHADAIILQTRRSWYYCLFSVLEYQSMSHGSANMDYIKEGDKGFLAAPGDIHKTCS